MFKSYTPSEILQPYIAFLYTLKCKKSDYEDKISEFSLPSGFGHMGFHLSGSFYIVQNNQKQELERFYTVGQQSQSYYINSDSDMVDFYGVTFQPTALWHFFGQDMPAITDNNIATASLLKTDIQTFTEEFDSNQASAKRIKLIDDLLVHELSSVQPQLTIIDSAIQRINETYGCCSIAELISNLKISERYLQKNFKKMVGITPSAYKRIVRFNFIMDEIRKDTQIDCKGLSAFYNYYDFSHFSSDFKKYCGVCPSKFLIDKFKFLQEVTNSEALLIKCQENASKRLTISR